MKKIHYRNIGFPKTGTTWLYTQLISHPDVDHKPHTAFKEFEGKSKEEYVDFYSNYDVSFNLRTNLYNVPEQLYYATHISMFLRNPYEILNSYHNFFKRFPDYKTTAKGFLNFDDWYFRSLTDMNKIFQDWKHVDLRFFFYDDLNNDPKTFMHSICEFIGIRQYHDPRIGKKLETNITEQLIFKDESIVKYINEQIEITENKTKRSLAHWKH